MKQYYGVEKNIQYPKLNDFITNLKNVGTIASYNRSSKDKAIIETDLNHYRTTTGGYYSTL